MTRPSKWSTAGSAGVRSSTSASLHLRFMQRRELQHRPDRPNEDRSRVEPRLCQDVHEAHGTNRRLRDLVDGEGPIRRSGIEGRSECGERQSRRATDSSGSTHGGRPCRGPARSRLLSDIDVPWARPHQGAARQTDRVSRTAAQNNSDGVRITTQQHQWTMNRLAPAGAATSDSAAALAGCRRSAGARRSVSAGVLPRRRPGSVDVGAHRCKPLRQRRE